MAENVTLTKQELQDWMLKQNEQNSKIIAGGLLDAIKELRKPTPEEQERLDAERRRKEQTRVTGVREANDLAVQKAMNQAACPHTKPDGRHTFSGRVLNNGDAAPACVRCQKEYRWQASAEERSNGGALFLMDRDYPFANWTAEQIEKYMAGREKASPPKQPADRPDLERALAERRELEASLAKAKAV